jgi:hypothetical protein
VGAGAYGTVVAVGAFGAVLPVAGAGAGLDNFCETAGVKGATVAEVFAGVDFGAEVVVSH